MYSCFHSVGLPALSIEDVIRRVARAGYGAIELNAETLPWAPPHVTPETTGERRAAIVDLCKTSGISIPAVGAHVEMVGAEKASRQSAIAFVEGCIDLARDLGAPIVHILSGPVAAGSSEAEAKRWFAAAVEQTVAYAEARDVQLGIEAIVGHAFRSVDDYHQLARDLPGVNFYVNFDPSHLEVQGENPARVIDELADRINHVHLKDGKGRYPDFSFPPLGEGAIDFHGLVSGLRKAGYAGAMSLEYEAQVYGYDLTEEQIVDGGLAYLKALGI